MNHKGQEEIALHRWAVIAEAANDRLTAAARGALVRQIAARAHTHPGGSARRYSRATIDRWLRAWRAGGLEALKPAERADAGTVRTHPELFAEAAALRLELAGRSAAQIASILFHRHGIRVAERTIRAQLRRAGLHREALAAEPKAYGRYEAARPNERWVTDVLVGPWVPWPRRESSVRARLFLIVDDHSRLLVDGRFFAHENARACQDLLRRAITRRGLPEILYADYADLRIMPHNRRGKGVCPAQAGEVCQQSRHKYSALSELSPRWVRMPVLALKRVSAGKPGGCTASRR
jgi:putative transposase